MYSHNTNGYQVDDVRVTFSQLADVEAKVEQLPYAQLLYGFQRARDLKEHKQPGQDHLAFRYNQRKFTFSVCDGVGQSFYGNLASQMLGSYLIDLMWEISDTDLKSKQTLEKTVTYSLNQFSEQATDWLYQHPIPDYLPPMQHKTLLQKQKETGSQTMFVSGRFDVQTNQLALCWMGDTAFRIWHQDESSGDRGKLNFSRKQSWSTKTGLLGGPVNSLLMPLDSLSWLTIYTDGLTLYEKHFDNQLSPESLQRMMTKMFSHPKNDDIAILQFHPLESTAQSASQLETPSNLRSSQSDRLFWDTVPRADWYRVTLKNTKGKSFTFAIDNNEFDWQWFTDPSEISVQAISKQALASKPAVFVPLGVQSDKEINLPFPKPRGSLPVPQPSPVLVPQPQTAIPSRSKPKARSYRLLISGLVSFFLLIILATSRQFLDDIRSELNPAETGDRDENETSPPQQDDGILNVTLDQGDSATDEPTPTLDQITPLPDSDAVTLEQGNGATTTPSSLDLSTNLPLTPLKTPEPSSDSTSESFVIEDELVPDHIDLQITTRDSRYRYDATFYYREKVEVCWNELPLGQIQALNLYITLPTQETELIPEENIELICFSDFEKLSFGLNTIVLEAVFHNGASLRSNKVIVRIR